jgi:hypothetical protein
MMKLEKRTAMVASSIVILFITLVGYLAYLWLKLASNQYAILFIVLALNLGVASMNIGLALRNFEHITDSQ